MIVGIGIDLVSIHRFANWGSYAPHKLRRIFTQPEIDYCRASPTKTAERFAARFALKEAFFKAITHVQSHTKETGGHTPLPFLKICKAFSYSNSELVIQWNTLTIPNNANLRVHHSLSHESGRAVALVIIEQLASKV